MRSRFAGSNDEQGMVQNPCVSIELGVARTGYTWAATKNVRVLGSGAHGASLTCLSLVCLLGVEVRYYPRSVLALGDADLAADIAPGGGDLQLSENGPVRQVGKVAGERVGSLERQYEVEQLQQGIDLGAAQRVMDIKPLGLQWPLNAAVRLETEIGSPCGDRILSAISACCISRPVLTP
jgi:hypothetical protein